MREICQEGVTPADLVTDAVCCWLHW